MTYQLQFGQIADELPYILGGIWPTLWISFVCFWAAAALGLMIALAKTGRSPVLRRLASFWVAALTFTPLFLLLYYLFNVLPSAGIVLSGTVTALVAITLNGSAYLAEIQRAGLASVRQSELDAAEMLGMSRAQTVRHVIAPHVVRTCFAPMSNWFILTVLGTSMAGLVGVQEVTGRAIEVSSRTFRSVEVFLVVALIYVGITLLASATLALVGRLVFRVRVRVW
jgi:polar amino acid transport system permease protein